MEKTIGFKGCLFDLDGTLINSMPSIHRTWSQWAVRHGMEPDTVLSVIHGRPARESIRELLPEASEATIEAEFAWFEYCESTDTADTTTIHGAGKFLKQLDELNIPWGIVTSGTIPVATARLKSVGIRQPEILITPELISQGKPHPEPYLLGAEKIQVDTSQCIVFEDAPAGVKSGLAAGNEVVAILSHMKESDLPNASAYINDYDSLTISKDDDTYSLIIEST